ncbi:MAG: hypothetical protein JXA69_11735, partial [Phycisphaerae bacterium]|nr:hypothetical protein [Phycisphaerae bacterium]
RVKLDREIDEDLARARRLLNAYEPGKQMLAAASERLTGQAGPLEATETQLAKWGEHWADVQSQVRESPLVAPSLADQRRLADVEQAYAGLTGDGARPEPQPANDVTTAYRTLKADLAANESRLQDAIALVDAAILKSVSSGSETYSGRDHVEANRLRAVLAYHDAEARRRAARLLRRELDRLAQQAATLHGRWVAVTSQLALAERAVGGEVTTAPAAASAPAEEAGHSALGPDASAAVADLHQQLSAIAQTSTALIDTAAIPVQVAQLESHVGGLRDAIAKLGQHIETLTEERAALANERDSQRAAAGEADRRMVEMENRGFDVGDPSVLDGQLSAYAEASRADRKASREADLLELGGYENAALTLDAGDLHTAPIVTGEPGEPLKSVRSLRRYDQELALLQSSHAEGQQALDVLLAKIEALRQLEAFVQRRLTGSGADEATVVLGLRAQRDALAQTIQQLAAAITTLASQADETEEAALDAITGPGITAAKQAKSALQKRQSEARGAQPMDGEPDPRLDAIVKESWRAGDATALLADLQALQAWIHYERSEAKNRHAGTLELLSQMGVEVDAPAQRAAATEQSAAAREAAELAVAGYADAESDLKNDWTVQVNLAGAYGVLAKAAEGSTAQGYRDQAREAYQRGIAGQTDDPARRPYALRLEALSHTEPAPKE